MYWLFRHKAVVDFQNKLDIRNFQVPDGIVYLFSSYLENFSMVFKNSWSYTFSFL